MLGRTISHYKILEKLGEGGMGVAYKAEDTRLKRTVALKFLPPDLTRDTEAKERFIREAQTASALEHSNICTIHEINETEDGQLFICMAYCDGEELKKKIERGPLKIDETIDIAMQITEGLREAHDKGIVHRDIKSGNIMVTTKGQAKIMDFGLAKLAGRTTLTKTGSTMGTIAYMSPEQARGEKVDNRTDIWSLGVVLYEMLSGQLPFKSEYEQAVVYSILYEDPQPIIEVNKNVPESLQTIVRKAMEKDIVQRYQNAGELLTDLRAVKSGFEVVKRPEIKRKISQAILFSLALVLAFILIFLFVRHKEKQIPRKTPIGVMFFDNQTGEDKYDYLRKVLADLLITDLSQSRYLQPLTFPRMFDLLKSFGYEDVEIIDASIGFKLCKLAGAHVMVLGTLTKSGETFVLNAELLDVDTKKQIAKPCRVTGKGKDSILGHLVDGLTDKIKRGMEISLKEIQQEKKDIAELTTTSLEAYKYYFAGREAAFRMYSREAIEDFEKAMALDSTFIEAYEALVRQYYTIGENTKALKIIEKIKSSSGKLAEEELVTILALEAYIKQDWDLAINYYKRLISLNPENISAHLDLGTVYYQKKRMYDEGISEFKKILELDPQGVTSSSSFAYNLLGWTYLRKEEWKKALGAFNKYVALLPNQAYPLDVLAEINLVVGDYDQAITNLQRSLEIKPDYPVTSALLGDVNLAKGMYSQAMRFYERYLALPLSEVKQAEGRLNLSNLYFLKGEYDQAVQECQKALELDPQMIEPHWIQGLIFVKEKMFDQADSETFAIEGLIEKMKTEDSKAYYYHLSGELSLSKGLYQKALENFDKATNFNPLMQTFFVNALGEAYFRIGELNKAIEKFEDVLKINPNYAQTHYLLSLVYQKQGKKDKAKGHLQKFMEIWKEADENLPQLIEARKRLAGL